MAADGGGATPGAGDRGGGTVGHYKIERLLGSGSFGEVRLASDRRNGRKVALKFITKGAMVDVAEVERVSREFFILVSLPCALAGSCG
jgi:serine/threonine protein kinase